MGVPNRYSEVFEYMKEYFKNLNVRIVNVYNNDMMVASDDNKNIVVFKNPGTGFVHFTMEYQKMFKKLEELKNENIFSGNLINLQLRRMYLLSGRSYLVFNEEESLITKNIMEYVGMFDGSSINIVYSLLQEDNDFVVDLYKELGKLN